MIETQKTKKVTAPDGCVYEVPDERPTHLPLLSLVAYEDRYGGTRMVTPAEHAMLTSRDAEWAREAEKNAASLSSARRQLIENPPLDPTVGNGYQRLVRIVHCLVNGTEINADDRTFLDAFVRKASI